MKRTFVAIAVCVAGLACGGQEGGTTPSAGGEDQEQVAASTPEASCVASGGTVRSSMCCQSVTAFPNSCLVGACGCAPAYSHPVPTCACPLGRCFDGARCVADPRVLEAICRSTGGTVVTASCCGSAGDFPNTCLVGACGCAPAYSHTVKSCRCPAGKCFDGTRCI